MALQQVVMKALRAELHEVEDGLETQPQTKRVAGVIISPAFEHMGHKKRQDKLWEILEAHLTPQQLTLVGPIATLTPADAKLSTLD